MTIVENKSAVAFYVILLCFLFLCLVVEVYVRCDRLMFESTLLNAMIFRMCRQVVNLIKFDFQKTNYR